MKNRFAMLAASLIALIGLGTACAAEDADAQSVATTAPAADDPSEAEIDARINDQVEDLDLDDIPEAGTDEYDTLTLSIAWDSVGETTQDVICDTGAEYGWETVEALASTIDWGGPTSEEAVAFIQTRC